MKDIKKFIAKHQALLIKNNHQYKKSVYENNFEMDVQKDVVDEFTYSVDEYFDKASVNFLSEWFFDEEVHRYTSFNKNPFRVDPMVPTEYAFPDTNTKLNSAIESFHIKEGLPKGSFVVFISEGSTPMIAAMILFAKQLGLKKIFSIWPAYFTVHKMCDVIGMDLVPCNNDLACFEQTKLCLPNQKSFLLVTDPIWSIGRNYSETVYKQLARWQKRTGSIIFIDGSFSYMRWYHPVGREPAVMLEPELTLRLVCPTKALCVHGLRFSYLLCPKAFSKEVARVSIANTGSSCYFGYLQRERLFQEMTKKRINPIGFFCAQRFEILKKAFIKNKIEYINPDCGFFMYANLDKVLRKKGVRHRYYWLNNKALDIWNPKYKGYAKINLAARKKIIESLIKDLS